MTWDRGSLEREGFGSGRPETFYLYRLVTHSLSLHGHCVVIKALHVISILDFESITII